MLELALTVLCWTGVVALLFGIVTTMVWIQHYSETCQSVQAYLSLIMSGIIKLEKEGE